MPPNFKSFLICVLYRPPDGSKYLNAKFSDLLHTMLTKANSKGNEFILTGDMNVDFLKKNNHRELKAILQQY